MILCLGTTPTVQRSLVFDRVTPDAVNRAREAYDYASGKSVNVARVVRTLGEEALAIGFAGGDRGAFLLRELACEGVRHDFVHVSAETRLCTTVIDRANGTATELVEEHARVEPPAAWDDLYARFDAALPRASVCVLSGSLPPGAPQDVYARCVARAAVAGCRTLLDARGEPLRQALRQPGFVVKLNRDELAETAGRPLPDDPALRAAMASARPEAGAVIVTLGAGGAVAFDGTAFSRVVSPKVDAVSAVGSGDAFAAGVAVGLSRGRTLAQACAVGAACGAANALTALAAHLREDDLRALLPGVSVVDW